MRGEAGFELMAGAGADEFARLRGKQLIDRARVLALDRLASEDHRAAVDLGLGETGFAVATPDEFAERGGVDQSIGQKWRQHNWRAIYDLAAGYDKAAR